MNIAFDATAILGPMSKNRGIGNYALTQFNTMMKLDKKNKYFFFNMYEDFTFGNIQALALEEYIYPGKDRFLLIDENYKNIFAAILRKFLKANEIDVFYITSPFEGCSFSYEREWLKGVSVVATVYDIIPYVFKNEYLKSKSMYDWYLSRIDMLRWVDKCLVISQSVKDDMVKHLGFNKNKIEIIWGAVGEIFREIDISNTEKEKLLRKFHICDNYIMCTGGDDNRKNIAGLIEAYSMLTSTIKDNYQLVIVCRLSDQAIDRYSKLSKKLGVERRVIFTNFVTDGELVQLYNLAVLMAFPSKYEGFGLPVVEAFACNTLVLTSNNSSLAEIAGDAAILVDPYSTKDIARGLGDALENEDTIRYKMRGKKRLEIFCWENVANRTISVIETFDRKGERFPKDVCGKIAFFTPLPPVLSGISDYSFDILSALCQYFDIDVFVDNYRVEVKLPDNVSVYEARDFRTESYLEIIYQIGNSEHHCYMYEYIRKYPGILVLHDYNLHDALQYYALHLKKDMNLYKNYLSEDLSSEFVEKYISKLQNGEVSPNNYDFEVNGFLINYAKKVIVHSWDSKRKLFNKDVKKECTVIPSYSKIEPLIDKKEFRQSLGYHDDDVIFASFGFAQVTKRILPILKAFARIAGSNPKLKYVIVGKMADDIKNEFNQCVVTAGLTAQVHVTGYVELKKFVRYIDIADVCLNLRFPYHGETSGSLMRILSKGKCAIVNRIGSFEEIPGDTVYKIADVSEMTGAQEVDAIYSVIKNLVDNPGLIIDYENAARLYAVEKLDLNIIINQYRNYILSQEKNILSEADLKNIAVLKIKNEYYTQQEIYSLSQTLARAVLV